MFDPSVFEHINAHLKELDIDNIREQLRPQTKGMTIDTPIFDIGAYLYRTRKVTPSFNKKLGIRQRDLIYPPPQVAKIGRVNREGQPVFYCSMSKEPAFFELPGLQPGDEVILSFWQTTERMFLNNIGYTQYEFEKLGAKRKMPWWSEATGNHSNIEFSMAVPIDIRDALSNGENSQLRRTLSEYFMHPVNPDETHHYKLTTAIAELHLLNMLGSAYQFSGLLYPSVRMWANGDNIALLPWYVDKHLKFRQAMHIRIDNREDTRISITSIDCAREFSSSGELAWLGRPASWTVQPGTHVRVELAAGNDNYGDYAFDKDGNPVHWSLRDLETGKLLESA
jgi:hypothetical protein